MQRSLDPVAGRAVEVALELGLFSCEPGTLEQLAHRLEVAPRGLRPLLFLLASLELIEQDQDLFRVAQSTPAYLAEVWPEVEFYRDQNWKELDRAVRTGKCVRPAIEGQADGGEFFTGVVDILFGLHSPVARHLVNHLPSARRVLDLGAGSAVWSLALAKTDPQVRVVAVDHQRVLDEVTSRFLQEHGVESQYELRAGSYHEVELEPEGYDLIYLGHVVHSEGWQASTSLLRRCCQALATDGVLVIAEMVGATPRSGDYQSNLFDLNMLMFTEAGLVFDRQELEQLAGDGGFSQLRWVEGVGQYPVLLARK